MSEKTKLFIYGSLRQGMVNNSVLKDQTYLGEDQIGPGYKLFSLGWFPSVRHSVDGIVKGEVYEVDQETLAAIDRIEGHRPNNPDESFFRPHEVETEKHGKAWVYIIQEEFMPSYAKEVESGDWQEFAQRE